MKRKELAQTALFAALCYIGFQFLKINITLPGGNTAIHLGNAFLVLAALLLGGLRGGLAGAIGMSLADLTSGIYVTSAPKTFVMKLLIGLVIGLVAHRLGHLDRQTDPKKRVLWSFLGSAAGMLFNVIVDPVYSYLRKRYLLGMDPDAADILAKWGALSTIVNAVAAVIFAVILYNVLIVPLKKHNLMEE